ncbi:MAG: hypothetical protein AB7D00_07245 [Rhodospirillaceae bacterium]
MAIIGPAFSADMAAAGARTAGLAWTAAGNLIYTDVPTVWTDEERAAVAAVLASHNPAAASPIDPLVRLAEIDAACIRPLRAIAAGTATEEDRTRLADLEDEATTLRATLAAEE